MPEDVDATNALAGFLDVVREWAPAGLAVGFVPAGLGKKVLKARVPHYSALFH